MQDTLSVTLASRMKERFGEAKGEMGNFEEKKIVNTKLSGRTIRTGRDQIVIGV